MVGGGQPNLMKKDHEFTRYAKQKEIRNRRKYKALTKPDKIYITGTLSNDTLIML